MRALVIFAIAVFSLATPPPPPCIVPLPLFYGLDYNFTLMTQNSSFPAIDRGTVTFRPLPGSQAWQGVIDVGQVKNTTFSNGYLSINGGESIGYLHKSANVRFGSNPVAPLPVMGYYGCDPKTGARQIELVPSEENNPLGFCVGERNGLQELFVKLPGNDGAHCVDATVAVVNAVR